MTWLRLDDDFASDGTIRRCRAVQWWPLILCAMKRGGGVASDDDIAPDVLADIGQGSGEAAGLAVERLKAAGKLVEVDGGWSTPAWSEFQPDPTASDRARRYRERNKAVASAAASRCVTVTSRDETVRHGDVTGENGSSRLTVQDMTEQNRTEQATVVAATSRTRVEPATLPSPPSPDGLTLVVESFRRTQSGRNALQVPPAVVAALADLTRIHGPDVVCEAIRRGMERSHGDLTLSYLRPVVDAVAKGEPEHRPKGSARTGQPSAAYKSVNGVAEPREVPEGKW